MTSSGRSLALVCDALTDDLGGLALRELDTPAPAAGELRLRVLATALNFPDLLMTQGRYQHRPELPFVPGTEACVEVLDVGPGVAGWQRGDRALAHARSGLLAQRVVLPAAQLRRVPPGLDPAHAAAFGAVSLTAFVAVVRRAALQRGETLLAHGASGGVGMAALQLGRHLGARVIATGTRDDKLALLPAQGADLVLKLDAAWPERVREATGGHGADVVFDPVGGDVFDASLRCIAWGGRLLVVGFAAGRIPSVAANRILLKGISVVGVRAGEYGRRDPPAGASALQEVDRLAAAGVFRPLIGARLPLRRALQALRLLEQRAVAGKIVVEP